MRRAAVKRCEGPCARVPFLSSAPLHLLPAANAAHRMTRPCDLRKPDPAMPRTHPRAQPPPPPAPLPADRPSIGAYSGVCVPVRSESERDRRDESDSGRSSPKLQVRRLSSARPNASPQLVPLWLLYVQPRASRMEWDALAQAFTVARPLPARPLPRQPLVTKRAPTGCRSNGTRTRCSPRRARLRWRRR